MGRSFWSRPHFQEGLDYLQFEYEVISMMAFWEKSKRPPKLGFLGPFQAQMAKSRVLWESFIVKQPPKIIFWDILYHKKPTGAHQKAQNCCLNLPIMTHSSSPVDQHGQFSSVFIALYFFAQARLQHIYAWRTTYEAWWNWIYKSGWVHNKGPFPRFELV